MILSACTQSAKIKTKLYFSYFESNNLKKEDALVIEYNSNDTVRNVLINFVDSGKFAFTEKIRTQGIFRGDIDSTLQMTHSFNIGTKIESNIGKELPPIISTWITALQTNKMIIDNKDSFDIIFYDEIVPAWAYTSSYYCKNVNLFLVFYDQQKDTYYKLTNADGLENKQMILKLANNLSKDTVFFGKFYKLPKVKAPLYDFK